MDDLIEEFLAETNEALAELDTDIVKLEQDQHDSELLSKIFRIMHTIKGTCGFLGLARLEKIAHSSEDVLFLIRDGDIQITSERVSLILESLDQIKMIVAALEEKGEEPEGDDSALIEKLQKVCESAESDTPPSKEEKDGIDEDDVNVTADAAGDESNEIDGHAVLAGAQEDEIKKEADSSDNQPGPDQPAAVKSQMANQSLRVNVGVLENLMTMVSELVLTRNQLLQILRTSENSDFTTPLQRLNHVVSDLQEGVMKTRMQPVGNAWAKLPRIIRDISMELGKKIELEMRGQDTELDRQVLEMIRDPLTHMVRNSADHGIESPEQRLAAGKAESGKIRLNSYHEGGHIIIEISDDGRGLSTENIKNKVLANGLATEEELETMAPQQIQQFIFRAGFSTSEQITSVSGRGVGMDVVRNNIEKIGGSIEMKSKEGQGTTFIIKIPLTLAIVSALIVEAGGERFAIPQLAVRELVMASSESDNRIEMIKGAPVFRLRNHLLPLVSLRELLGLEPAVVQHEDEGQEPCKYIVVVQLGNYTFGIIVDRVFDTEEIVVKPVAPILKDIDIFSGNTILGDGSVIMILDPSGIAKRTGEVDSADARDAGDELARKDKSSDLTSLLLFSAGSKAPKAVPLELVSRLEVISLKDIEMADQRMVIQYRGELMPLFSLAGDIDINSEEKKPILVFADEERSMGLVADEIIDITEAHLDVQLASENNLLGSAIINERSTDIVDVAYYLNKVRGNWYKNHGDEPFQKNTGNGHDKKRLLLVEDSPFFRNMLVPLLSMAGYEVTTMASALEALSLCERGDYFDVIVSDIEMPEMDGFEFAEKVKSDPNWQNIPLVALTSHATPQDMDRGLEAGFNKYVAKFDRDTLLDTLSQTIAQKKEAA